MSQLLGASLLLAGCGRQTPTERDAGLIKTFGLPPDRCGFRHIYAAGAAAEILLYALVPQWMIGWSKQKSEEAFKFLPPEAKNMPFLGSINGRGSSVSFEALLRKKVDLVVDMGERTPTYVSTAARISAQLHVPYALIDGRLALAAEQVKQVGWLVRSTYIESLTSLAQRAIAFAATVSADIKHGIRVYYARGADGLETGLKDSIHTEVINLLGAVNCADALGTGGLGRVTLEQVLHWQPDIILTQDKQFMQTVYQQAVWQHVRAVKHKNVYLIPSLPVGWMDGPPGINRLLGIYALAPIFQQLERNYYSDEIQQLYQSLYHTALTFEQLRYLGIET
ncbi:ABC transporter substrate-binding protein [Neisseriaceae bacterium ESL0693]|nr:ABC transporter substrate-binding protein [Neisseriaceae bacterium ESL0693]